MKDVIYSYLKKKFYSNTDFLLKKYTQVNDNKSIMCEISVKINHEKYTSTTSNINFYHMRYVTVSYDEIIRHERELKIIEILC